MSLHPGLRFDDPVAFARSTVAAHDVVLAGGAPSGGPPPRGPAVLDAQVLEAWRRSGAAGVSPDQREPSRFLAETDLWDARSRTPLDHIAGEVVRAVADTSAAGRHLVVLTDADGVVLWRAGSHQAMRGADTIAFAEGADWSEAGIGTNGISRALDTGRLTHVTAGEHFVRAHHGWTCTAAPIRGVDGTVLGVLDVSLPVRFATAEGAALVRCGVRLAEALLTAGSVAGSGPGSGDGSTAGQHSVVRAIRLQGFDPHVVKADGSRVPLTARRAELLALLASREAWTGRALAEALYDDPDAATTVRGEIRRLRQTTGLTVSSQPYALADEERARVDFLTADDATDLLPDSDVPAIIDLRYT
ncbi:helix-turn-helix domain-containing protein [Brevibacterium yomogidense]|uniref:helix-turn-helix domain-containing protein n=1 Tax=Brevibacterium yomogidense TaxID=946573 RepID=UPI0018E018F7|nr:helix-turn-helix domain-containing protein [Brevibacterium yomogidense]